MSNFLISIGSFSERALPIVCSALACGAAKPVRTLDIFHLSSRIPDESLSSFIDTLNGFQESFPGHSPVSPFFQTRFSCECSAVALPQIREFTSDSESELLFSALRGRNMPVSFKTDRDAVEWSFSYLLSEKANDSCDHFFGFVDRIQSELSGGKPVRLALMMDPFDCFSSAVAVVLLPWLRSMLSAKGLNIVLLALADSSLMDDSGLLPEMVAFVQELKDRSLLRNSEEEIPAGADAMWFISLPSTLVTDDESCRIVFLSAARILGRYFASDKLPAVGLHTRRISGTLSLYNLQDEAAAFAGFIVFSSWILSDLLPSAVSAIHEVRPRPFRLNSRHNLLNSLFDGFTSEEAFISFSRIKKALLAVLRECACVIRSVPLSLRYSPEMEASWKKAVDTCGRYITVAAEYDTAKEDLDESGIGKIHPVHRDSLDDTEEEMMVARLEQMADQVNAEKAGRDAVLGEIGPFRSFQVKIDCLEKCENALDSAREKMKTASPTEDHLAVARQERRIRLLQAAVNRISSELHENPGTGLMKTGNGSDSTPYLPVALSSRGLHVLLNYLSDPEADTAVRELKETIPGLLEGYSLPDARNMMKAFQQECRSDPYDNTGNPAEYLISHAWTVCSGSVSALRFHSLGKLPEVPLLPDLFPVSPLLTLSALLSLMKEHIEDRNTPPAEELRGILAMLVLRFYRRRNTGEAEFSAATVSGSTPYLRCWLSAHHADTADIFSLRDEEHQEIPFLISVPAQTFIPAKRGSLHAGLIPSFVTWYDADSDTFRNPVPDFSDGDRILMSEWVSSVLDVLPENAGNSLRDFLVSFAEDIRKSGTPDISRKALEIRLAAVNGLRNLPAYRESLIRNTCVYENGISRDPLASGITGKTCTPVSCAGIPEQVVYMWRGIPFARENSMTILESAHAADEEHCLKMLSRECGIMADWSDDYRDQLIRETASMLGRFPDAIPECRETASEIIARAGKPLSDQSPELQWPWDPLSPSVRTVFRECLGDALGMQVIRPFSDKLAVFPARGGDIIGDSLFSGMCSVLPYSTGTASDPESFSADAVLPPLSADFVQAVSRYPEARLLLAADMIRMERPDESSIRVILTLNGAFPLRLVRIYRDEDIITLFSQDIPTLAVWPSVPFTDDMWNAYFVYAHLPDGFSVEVLSGKEASFVSLSGSDSRFTSVLPDFPSAFVVMHEGNCIGTVPNFLPQPETDRTGPYTVCLDFGSVGTSVVFSSGMTRKPLQGPVMVRTVINNPLTSQELLRREFLPAVPVSALLPTVSRIFRNTPGVSPVPFADGTILMSANIQDLLSTPSDALYTCLKWEEEKGRSGYICLHQVMLMAALQARIDGADSLSWRFGIPDEMAHEGRENLRILFMSLAEKVMMESGFRIPESGLPVSLAAESAALGAYFRLCASEDTRGGFMVLDIGACTADISLFLRGREQAVRTCQIPLGIHYMLLPALLRDPLLLKREFGNIADDVFQADLNQLTRVLKEAGKDSVSLRKARLALDLFLSDYYPLMLSLMNQYRSGGIPTRFGALLLLHVSFLMMLSGLVLLQIAADPNKNDFLPEQMSLCLSGRGSLILEQMPEDIKAAVWHFLTMFRNRRVASLSLLFSAEKKMEIPVGLSILNETYSQLPPASSVPASIAVRPEELLPEFLLRFARTFPLSASVLFPGFFTSDPYHPFSELGESTVTAAIDQSFFDRETPRPYNSLAAWIVNLLEDIPGPEA